MNIDYRNGQYHGWISVYEMVLIDGRQEPYFTFSRTTATAENVTLRGTAEPPTIHGDNGDLLTKEQIDFLLGKVPDFELPNQTSYSATAPSNHELVAQWRSTYPSGQTRTDRVRLTRHHVTGSKVPHRRMRWSEFKEFALAQSPGYIYRGQPRRWSLSTSFHRSGRADLIGYLDIEVPEVERHINMFATHLYDASNDRSLGALLNLVQHHGYPTPLLDWTRSPYVAAFFAFENPKLLKKDGDISIFMFEEARWSERVGRFAPLRTPKPMLRTLVLPGYGNARVIPQQSITMYSNIDDIEWLIRVNESTPGELLSAIAIPTADREAAMRDLALMGLTWGSLFPGLDGVCKELRDRHF